MEKLASGARNLRALVEGAERTDCAGFVQLVDDVLGLLAAERGRVGRLTVEGRLVRAPPSGGAVVVGDLHGDLDSLAHILGDSGFLDRAQRAEDALLVFLGDYGDRGPRSPEVYHVVLSLKEMFPENVVLMRGNHEGPPDLLAQPHDLPAHLHRKFGTQWPDAYARLQELFGHLQTAVLVEGKCVMLHGGVPSAATSVGDLAHAHERHPAESHLEEILWSDPVEGLKGTLFSLRGAGRLFGGDVTERFLGMLGVGALIRGHEPSDEGFKLNHGGRVLTLFSRKGPPYHNRQGAYLRFDLSEGMTSAEQLMGHARKF